MKKTRLSLGFDNGDSKYTESINYMKETTSEADLWAMAKLIEPLCAGVLNTVNKIEEESFEG